jgi:hypothetical protein
MSRAERFFADEQAQPYLPGAFIDECCDWRNERRASIATARHSSLGPCFIPTFRALPLQLER